MSGQVNVKTGTYLDRILTLTAIDLEFRKQEIPTDLLREKVSALSAPIDVISMLRSETVSVIAEFKRASPSRGMFPGNPNVEDVARAYLEGGASMISCLTDTPFFHGTLQDLALVSGHARAAEPPVGVLRKDFIIDRFQIDEARACGASCILLIVAALNDDMLSDLHSYALHQQLAVLVEVHDMEESKRALDVGARMIGVNNRDLRTFEVDISLTERLARILPSDVVRVGESGIATLHDVERMAAVGVDAVLVGESLIRQSDRAAAVHDLTGVKVSR